MGSNPTAATADGPPICELTKGRVPDPGPSSREGVLLPFAPMPYDGHMVTAPTPMDYREPSRAERRAREQFGKRLKRRVHREELRRAKGARRA